MQIPIDQQNIINILGIESLPDERKVSIVDQASELVQKRLFIRIMENFSLAKREQFLSAIEKDDQAAVGDFLAQNVPEMGDWLFEEVNKIKQEFSQLASKIK